MKQNDEPIKDAELDDVQETASQESAEVTEHPSLGEGQGVGSEEDPIPFNAVTESDDTPVGQLTLKQIVGGDFLMLLVRNHIWLIVLIVLITTIYVGIRYQCQQDVIEIDRLEKELTDAKYKAMSSSSNLTELCRQSHVLQVLRANRDSLLHISDQPPYKIQVPEED